MRKFESITINHQTIPWSGISEFRATWAGDPEIPPFLEAWSDEQNIFPALTSGSTGKPTRVLLRKEYAVASALATIEHLDLQAGNNVLLSMPAAYIAGRMMIVRAIVGNFNLLPVPLSSTPQIPSESIGLAAFTPHQFYNIVDSHENLNHLNIQNILLGGAPVSENLIRQIKGFRGRIYETFGMTETYSHVAMKMRYPVDEDLFTAVGPARFRERDNRLIVDAPHLGIDGLETRDVVELEGPKKFRWVGRADFVINSGGIKIFPEMVEKKLIPVIKQPFFITGRPDPEFGQRVVLVIEGAPSGIPEKQLMDQMEKVLGKYEKPKSIVWVDTMVYTQTGKINRTETVKQII